MGVLCLILVGQNNANLLRVRACTCKRSRCLKKSVSLSPSLPISPDPVGPHSFWTHVLFSSSCTSSRCVLALCVFVCACLWARACSLRMCQAKKLATSCFNQVMICRLSTWLAGACQLGDSTINGYKTHFFPGCCPQQILRVLPKWPTMPWEMFLPGLCLAHLSLYFSVCLYLSVPF